MRLATGLALLMSVGPLECVTPIPVNGLLSRGVTGGRGSPVNARSVPVVVTDFGAVGDGVADDTAAIQAAILAAKGSEVAFPQGIFRVTAPLTGSSIRIRGEAPAYITNHGSPRPIPDTYNSSFAEEPSAELGSQLTIILCDGTGLIGAPDASNAIGASSALRSLRDVVLWGENGSKIGLHLTGADTIISGCTFVLFQWFGILSRGLITSAFRDLAFIDCGWALPSAGTPATGNYISGTGHFISASMTPGDLTAIDVRPTTLTIDNTFAWQRHDTQVQESGFRTLIAYGVVSSAITALQGYSGVFMFRCTGTSLKGYHLEDYSTSGVSAGDKLPYALYLLDTEIDVGAGYAAHMTGLNPGCEVYVAASNDSRRTSRTMSVDAAGIATTGPLRSDLRRSIAVTTPGATEAFVFPNAIAPQAGFTGLCVTSLVQADDHAQYSRSIEFVGAHDAGGSVGWLVTSIPLARPAGTFTTGDDVNLSVSFKGPDLVVSVAWGPRWTAGTRFILSVGLLGTSVLSSL